MADKLPVYVGKRYVFFSTLSNPDPDLPEKRKTQLQNLGKAASNKLEAIDNLLTGGADLTKDSSTTLSLIETYLNFIEKQAQIARTNESFFIQQQLQRIKQIKDQYDGPELNELLDFFKNFEKEKITRSQYDEFFTIINNLLLPEDKREEILSTQINNIKIIQQNYLDKAFDEERKKCEESYLNGYETYRGQFLSKLTKSIGNNFFNFDTLNQIIAERINNIIQGLSKDTNSELLEKLKEKINPNQSQLITEQQVLEELIKIITQQVLLDLNLTISDLAQQTIETMDTTIQQVVEENALNLFLKKTQKSLEELAMKREGQFEDIANAFLNLNSTEQGIFLKTYENQLSSKFKINDPSDPKQVEKIVQQIRTTKSAFTREVGQILQQKIINDVLPNLKEDKRTFQNIKDYFQSHKKDFITERNLSQDLRTQLQVTKITGSSVAELMASKDVQDKLVDVALNKVPGNIINLKDDIQFFIAYTPKPNSELSNKQKEIVKNLNDIVQKSYADFLPTYKNLSPSTSVTASRKALASRFTEMGKVLEEKHMNNTKLKKLLAKLQEGIIGSISVKDYLLYNNELGFHGGALGASDTSNAVIENIMEMYSQGGISHIDADNLIFAVINCTSSTYGNEAMLQHIANFLLGGAALLMFDEDFGQQTLELIENKMGQQLFKSVKNVSLYYLNGVYIPSSYILFTIHDELQHIYEDIIENFVVAPKTNYIHITTHSLTANDIPDPATMPNSLDRWHDISQKAMKNTKIKFLFMAGLLDIMEKLAQSFNIKNV